MSAHRALRQDLPILTGSAVIQMNDASFWSFLTIPQEQICSAQGVNSMGFSTPPIAGHQTPVSGVADVARSFCVSALTGKQREEKSRSVFRSCSPALCLCERFRSHLYCNEDGQKRQLAKNIFNFLRCYIFPAVHLATLPFPLLSLCIFGRNEHQHQ